MEEIILHIVKISIPLSVIVCMFGLGLRIAGNQLEPFKERPLLMLRSLAVVLLVVPAAVLALILLLKPVPEIAVGLAIIVAAPAAPMQLVRASKKGVNLPYMVSLHLSLSLLALLTTPVTLLLFSSALSFQIEAGVLAVGKVVALTVLAPVGIGILIRSLHPRVAESLGPAVSKAGVGVLAISVLFVAAGTWRDLARLDLFSYFTLAVVVTVSLGIGHLLGPRDAQERTTLAMESASRGMGLALTIAVLHFRPDQALQVMVPYLVVFTVISAIYLRLRHRALGTTPSSSASGDPARPSPASLRHRLP